jgi:hypothetical protein
MKRFQAEIETQEGKQKVDIFWREEEDSCCTHTGVHTQMGRANIIKSIRVWDPAERISEFSLSFQRPQTLDLTMNSINGILSQLSE